jgi:hypothetical protein
LEFILSPAFLPLLKIPLELTLLMVPEYRGSLGKGTLVAENSFLTIRNHKTANQASRESGMLQPCFQRPETVELNQQWAPVRCHGASTSPGFAIVLDVFDELSTAQAAYILVVMLVNLTAWGNEFLKSNAFTEKNKNKKRSCSRSISLA